MEVWFDIVMFDYWYSNSLEYFWQILIYQYNFFIQGVISFYYFGYCYFYIFVFNWRSKIDNVITNLYWGFIRWQIISPSM